MDRQRFGGSERQGAVLEVKAPSLRMGTDRGATALCQLLAQHGDSC